MNQVSPDVQREVTRIFEKARKSQSGTPPRKQHVVPAFYLRHWADDGKLRVTDIDRRHSYVTTSEKAARETDFYSLADEQLDEADVPPLLMETILSEVEGAAADVTERLIADGIDALTDDHRLHFATFLAFQSGRGPSGNRSKRW